jgi:hypothetical protein
MKRIVEDRPYPTRNRPTASAKASRAVAQG